MPIILYMILGLLSLIWGGSFFFIKILLEFFDPWTITFLRCLFGTLTLLLLVLVRREKIEAEKLPWMQLILVGLANSAIPWTLIAFSETRLDSSLTSVLNAFTPICTLLIGISFFQVKATLNQWIGIAFGFTGIVILMDLDGSNLNASTLGFLAMLIVTLSYGWSAQMSKRHFQPFSVYVISLLTLGSSTLASGVVALLTESPEWSAIAEPAVIGSFIGIGVFGSGIAYVLFYKLIQQGSAEFATLVTYLVPPFAILWGFLFLHEDLSLLLFIGLGVILSGVFIAGQKRNSADPYRKHYKPEE